MPNRQTATYPPVQITFRGIDRSATIEKCIRDRAARLDRFYDRIISCRVTIDSPHRHRHKGKLYSIRLDLTIPGHEIAVTRESQLDHSHEDIYVAIRDSFNEAKRRIQDYARRRQGKVKSHVPPAHGRIISLDPEHDRGVIESSDGTLFNFHRNSVPGNAFNKLKKGDEARFVTGAQTPGEEPWATTVNHIGKHRIVAP